MKANGHGVKTINLALQGGGSHGAVIQPVGIVRPRRPQAVAA